MKNFLALDWVQAIGWTLLHSIWQLALIGALAWLCYRATVAMNPARRYQVMVLFLISCLIVPVFTFIGLGFGEDTPAILRTAGNATASQIAPVTDAERVGEAASWHGLLFNQLHWLTLAWLLGVLALGVRALGAYLFLQYLRREGAATPPAAWQYRFELLKMKMGVSQAVLLLESTIVKTPVAFGYFKPVVMIPAGWLTNLPPDQVEALLLHELAHVLRSDFLVNFLLSIITILLFYHPAIHWLAARIRELREESCDDLAVAGGADPVVFAECLLAIVNQKNIALTMNAASQSSHFSRRIQRLLAPPVTEHADRFTLIPFITSFVLLVAVFFTGVLQAQSPAVSVAADKMNVLYIGVDNPLTVAVAGVPSENIRLYSDELTLVDKGNGNYIALAKQPGKAAIRVEAGNKALKELQFRVKRIPDPTAVYNGLTSGAITAEEFKKQADLSVALTSDYEGMSCHILSCSIIWVRPKEDPIEVFVREGGMNERAKQLIEKAAPGDFYYFENIKAKCPGGERPLNALVFRIIE